jgi:hypothetical protein
VVRLGTWHEEKTVVPSVTDIMMMFGTVRNFNLETFEECIEPTVLKTLYTAWLNDLYLRRNIAAYSIVALQTH